MSFNGSGTFLINSAGQPVVANTVISATVFNALTADLATGLSTAITKDGQTTVTANIPFGNNKITTLGAGTAATDAANLGQVQSTAAKLITVTGTDTITGSMSPQLTAYAAGQLLYFIANAANTGAVTINVDGLGAKAITRDGSTALAAGDINSGEVVVIVYDGTRFQMINAANSFGNTTINGTLTVTGNTGLQANVSITSALSVGGTFNVTGAAALGSTLSVTGKSDLPTVSTASINAAVALITTGTVTNLTATGASIASANIGNLQFTAASIASINAGVAVVTNLTATSASIASANVGTAVITTGTVTNLTSTSASVASMNAGVALLTTATVTNLTATGASVASANFGNVVTTTERVTNFSATSASIASINAAVALVTTGTVTNLTSTSASIASANIGTAVVTGLTVTGASIASVNAGTATLSGNLTLNGGTANGVLYLNGSKVATSGSALVFDGTNFAVGNNTPIERLEVVNSGGAVTAKIWSATGTSPIASLELQRGTNQGWGVDAFGDYRIRNDGGELIFQYGESNVTSERFRITGTGNAVIGNGSTSATPANGLLRGTDGSGTDITGATLTIQGGRGTGSGAGGPIVFSTSAAGASGTTLRTATERMRLDSSGNLGLGVTPPAANTVRQLFVGSRAMLGSASDTHLTHNAVYNSNWLYRESTFASMYQQASGRHEWYTAPTGTAGNAITFTQVLAVEGGKSLALEGATSQSGTGITFPATQSASSNANTLDDYEEGTWTGTLKGSTTDPTTPVTATGTYVKIGRQVTVNIQFANVDTTGAAGAVTITGVPFAASGNHTGAASCFQFDFDAGQTSLACFLDNTATTLEMFTAGDSANWATLKHSAGAGRYLRTTLVYQV